MPDARSPMLVARRLLRWFDLHRRDLPWRRTRDPYRIWLAEIMLQQTRVPVVVPYYRRFLRAFPTVEKLARARLDQVLRFWAGLGYYQRARYLHAAAKKIVREHGGQFPTTLEAALALPGVGAYTARAVLSIAYRQPAAVVDGNVARTLARLFRLKAADVNDRAALQPLADRLVSRQRPGDFNQALMELGSMICLPRIPRCQDCPLEKICRARQAGIEREIPLRRRQRPRPRVRLNVLVLRRDGRVLIVREPRGYFSGLWHFPYTSDVCTDKLAQRLGANGTRALMTLTHETTMRDLELRVHLADTRRNRIPTATNLRWVRPAQLQRLGVGAATRKIVALLEKAAADGADEGGG
ncbi:MAG TPA: A/G-specific adenine glycosylase [Candidatus Acidoferrales bacterium]|nr:A/G-specific adenine glycosylase [Candidatus Acidoferrales bacterium]